jgi:hypothetical protein
MGIAPYLDHFADISKMVVDIKSAVFTGKFRLINNLREIAPLSVVQLD